MTPEKTKTTETPHSQGKPFPWRCPECGKKEVRPATVQHTSQIKHDGRLYTVEVPQAPRPAVRRMRRAGLRQRRRRADCPGVARAAWPSFGRSDSEEPRGLGPEPTESGRAPGGGRGNDLAMGERRPDPDPGNGPISSRLLRRAGCPRCVGGTVRDFSLGNSGRNVNPPPFLLGSARPFLTGCDECEHLSDNQLGMWAEGVNWHRRPARRHVAPCGKADGSRSASLEWNCRLSSTGMPIQGGRPWPARGWPVTHQDRLAAACRLLLG